jgi:TolB-like protein
MGGEKEHAEFADGVQDDILTKINDLKVISRTSVMEYRGSEISARSAMRFACLTCWREAHAGAVIGFT